MKIKLLFIGETQDDFVKIALGKYFDRLKHYVEIEIIELSFKKSNKSLTESQIKLQEAEQALKKISIGDFVVLLDEKGSQLSSKEFSKMIQKYQLSGNKSIVFVIGGAYGFADELYKRANQQLALSKMTFTHQFARVILVEQIYRAYTILKNEPYHHE